MKTGTTFCSLTSEDKKKSTHDRDMFDMTYGGDCA